MNIVLICKVVRRNVTVHCTATPLRRNYGTMMLVVECIFYYV